MYQRQNPNRKFMLLLSFLSVMFIAVSCKKDKEVVSPGISPSQHILESEQLAIPATIELPSDPGGHTRVATYYAVGVQKYVAQKNVAPGGSVSYSWVLREPRADLYDVSNNKVGTHSIGPTWQLTQNDSIYGQPFAPAKFASSPDGGSIDWLLLKAKDGKTTSGVFENVTYIQRIATKGGKAPAYSPQSANEMINIPYTAIYRFTKKNP
jgi:hypothetical protein